MPLLRKNNRFGAYGDFLVLLHTYLEGAYGPLFFVLFGDYAND